MSIRLPLKTVFDQNNSTVQSAGPTSVAGGAAYNFTIPLDTDQILVKYTTSTVGAGASAVLQTSDDGGTTWYDVARTSIVSNAISGTAQWLAGSTISPGMATGINQLSSILTVGIGSAAASTLGAQQISGLPIMGQNNRVFIRYGAVTSIINERVTVYANQQSK